MDLADVLPAPEAAASFRRARVLSVSGRMLTVDLGGTKVIPSLDSCNPIPGQWVYIIGEGSSMMAVGALGGAWRQPTLIATSSTTTTVTGLLNGVSRAVTKAGAFTVTNGDELPLFWAADGSDVWVLGKAGVPYVPPTPGEGGGGGGGATSGTATYPATQSGYRDSAGWHLGNVTLGTGRMGGLFYGSSRFKGLQGRTITGFRINLRRLSGSGSVTLVVHNLPGPSGSFPLENPQTSVSPTGWRSLPISIANWMIAGSGTGGFAVFGSGALRGIPYGTLQFDWRK